MCHAWRIVVIFTFRLWIMNWTWLISIVSITRQQCNAVWKKYILFRHLEYIFSIVFSSNAFLSFCTRTYARLDFRSPQCIMRHYLTSRVHSSRNIVPWFFPTHSLSTLPLMWTSNTSQILLLLFISHDKNLQWYYTCAHMFVLFCGTHFDFSFDLVFVPCRARCSRRCWSVGGRQLFFYFILQSTQVGRVALHTKAELVLPEHCFVFSFEFCDHLFGPRNVMVHLSLTCTPSSTRTWLRSKFRDIAPLHTAYNCFA